MSELAVRQSASAAVSIIQTAAADMDAAHRLASALVSTAFAPAHFRGKPDDATAAILYGAAIGMDPLASMQNIYVISGRPAMYARAMMAVVLSHGHDMWTETDTPEKVTVCGRRKGTPNVERSEWTYDRARKAGYTSNKKYDTDPQSMLFARASGDVARRVAPDALLGMAYSVEELEQAPAGPDGTPTITTARTGTQRLAEAIGATAPAKPAEAPQEPVKTTSERAEPGITKDQLTALNAGMTSDLGLSRREAKLAYLSAELGRDIGSSSEVTKAEASALIDKIKRDAENASQEFVEEPPADWEPEQQAIA